MKINTILLTIVLTTFLGFSQENENNDIAKKLYDNGDFTKENKIPSDIEIYKIKFEKFIDFDTIKNFVGINFFRPNILIVDKKTSESDIKSNKIILKNQKILFDEDIKFYKNKKITSYDYDEFYRFFPIENGETDRVGMEFSVTNIKNNETIKDILICGNIWDYYGRPIYFAFFKSELTKRIDNIKQHNLSLLSAKKEEDYGKIKKSIEGFEKKLFPNDCLYLIGVKYRIFDLKCRYESDDFNTKFKQNNTIYNYGFSLSNSNNKSDYLPVIERNAKLTEEDLKTNCPLKWEVDSTWIEKKIDIKDFKDLTEPYHLITFKSFSNSLSGLVEEENNAEINSILNDKSKAGQFDNWEYWTKKVKDKDLININLFIEFVPYSESETKGFGIKLYTKVDGDEKFYTIENKNFFNNVNYETYKLFDNNYNKILNPNYTFTDVINPFLFDFKNSYKDYKNRLYDINDSMLRKLIGLEYLERFKYRLIQDQERFNYNNDQENQKIKNEKIKIGLIKKFGKKYVDLALAGNIVVGMPEELLPIPLKLWKITSRSNWKNGYRIYCTSLLDSSAKLSVYVGSGKVTMVGY